MGYKAHAKPPVVDVRLRGLLVPNMPLMCIRTSQRSLFHKDQPLDAALMAFERCSLFYTPYYSRYRTVGRSRHWLVQAQE